MRISARIAKQTLGTGLRVAEIGVRDAINAVEMLEGLDIARFYAVDPYMAYQDGDAKFDVPLQSRHYMHAFKALTPYFSKVVMITRTSAFASALMPAYGLDYVYIDADHSYEAVKQDLRYWWPKVRRGGLFSGHDASMISVKRATQEFSQFVKLPLEVEEDDWMIRKPA